MAEVVFRQRAIDDLSDIWNYTTERWSVEQADRYYLSIKLACTAIGENPKIGKVYHGIKKNLLGFRTGKHIVFYQSTSKDRIEVVRILHGRMDLKNRLTEE